MTDNPLKVELKRPLNEKLEEYSRKLIKTPRVKGSKLCPFCLEIITGTNHLGPQWITFPKLTSISLAYLLTGATRE